MMSALAVAITGGDAEQINLASAAGANAAANNYLNHTDAAKLQALRAKCAVQCSTDERTQMNALIALNLRNDQAFIDACQSPLSSACKAETAKRNAAFDSYTGQTLTPGEVSRQYGKLKYEVSNNGVPSVKTTTEIVGKTGFGDDGFTLQESRVQPNDAMVCSYSPNGLCFATDVKTPSGSYLLRPATSDEAAENAALLNRILTEAMISGGLTLAGGAIDGYLVRGAKPTVSQVPKAPGPVPGTALKPIYRDVETGLNAVNPTSSVSRAEVDRLAWDSAVGKVRPGEGNAAAQYQNATGNTLERVNPADYPPGTPKPDFVVVSGPNAGQKVDFMFAVDSEYAAVGMNNNFLKTDRAIAALKKQLVDHAAKADVVPLDFRKLTAENQQLLMDKVISLLSPAEQAKLIILR